MEEMVTITKEEHQRLLDAEAFLSCLQACGVDNWCGYSDAQDMYDNEEDED